MLKQLAKQQKSLFECFCLFCMVWGLLTGCTADLAPPLTDAGLIQQEYPRWTRLNEQPHPATLGLWLLCRTPTAEEQALLDSPHADYFVNFYVNGVGMEMMGKEGERLFPAGTIIVKEKLIGADSQTPTALGMMIKHETGYDPDSDDWEYLYWEEPNSLTTGADLNHCRDCHITQQEGDSIFWYNPTNE